MSLKNMLLNMNGVKLEQSDKLHEKYTRIQLAKEAIQRKWVVKLSRIPENKLKSIQKNERESQNNLEKKRKTMVKIDSNFNLLKI